MDYKTLTLSQLGAIIRKDWKNPYFGAAPYIQAMIDGFHDGERSTMNYFLANAATWKGETAKAVKAELKRRTK